MNVYLKPIFSSKDINNDLKFVNCTLGFNGNINGKLLNELDIGTGINDIQTNGKNELWVSYSDIGIYQGDNIEEKGSLYFLCLLRILRKNLIAFE
jgi:hypothetical protein